MLSETSKNKVLTAVKLASERWKTAFNNGDFETCALQYEDCAIMKVEPFGKFVGRKEIAAFWQNLIDDGFSDVEYLMPDIAVIDNTSAVLTSGWKMNKASGTISRELWVLQADGTAQLKEDNFEVAS